MAELCPDCGRDKSPIDRCSAESIDDDGECPYLTIARLRRELANALAINSGRTYCMDSPEVLKARVGELEKELAEAAKKVEAAEWHVSDYDAGDSAALHELRAAVDDSLGWASEASQEAGDYVARVVEVGRELAEARAIGELERAALERAVAARVARRAKFEDFEDNGIRTEYWRRVNAADLAEFTSREAIDALIAARAAAGEAKEADRG